MVIRHRNRPDRQLCQQINYKAQHKNLMKVNNTEDRKSTVDSNKRIKTRERSQTKDDEKEEGQINVFSPRGSSQNLNTVKINLVPAKKTTEMSVSPRKQVPQQDDLDSDRQLSVGPSNGSTIQDEAVSRYECIATLTEQENRNLREQNKYLIQKLRKMQERESKVRKLYEKAKKYKILYQDAQMEVQVLKDQCQIYKDQAQEMKKIILNDVHRLKQKVIESEINGLGEEIEVKKSEGSTERQSSMVSHSSSLSKYIKCGEV